MFFLTLSKDRNSLSLILRLILLRESTQHGYAWLQIICITISGVILKHCLYLACKNRELNSIKKKKKTW